MTQNRYSKKKTDLGTQNRVKTVSDLQERRLRRMTSYSRDMTKRLVKGDTTTGRVSSLRKVIEQETEIGKQMSEKVGNVL